ncbi:MAG: TIGR03663 family protein, partial [Dehalococcoidia bacterium]|nr:TIGR03663 family protein [Dehalococcoidia bacterium]
SRFLREDIFMVVWTLLTVIFMWRYLDDRRPRNLYFLAAALALSFSQKETAFINMAIFGSFLFFMFITSAARRSKPSDDVPGPNAMAGRLLIVVGSLVLPLFIGGVKLVERLPFAIRLPGPTDPNAVALFGGILLVVLAVCAIMGHWWNGPLWNRLAILFWAIYVALYTTFLSNIAGIGTGVVGSLTYWLDQQGVKRGDQPGYYYYILLSLYEFLPVILGIIAIIYYRFKRSVFINFLVYWTALALVMYSLAAEKMPWLSLHIALPLIILSGRLIGDLLSGIPWRRLDPRFYLSILLSILLLLFLGATILTWGSRGLEAVQARQEAVGGVLFFLGFVALEIWLLRSQGARLALKALAVAGLVVLLGLTVRTTLRASFQNGDTPVEMMVYTQTSPDIPVIYTEIEQLSFWKTGGKDLTIWVDGASGFSWPWAWYLRDYKNASYPALDNPTGPITADVVLVHSSNVDKVRPLLTGYTEGKRYHHRWWFPETLYRDLTPQKSVTGLFDGASWVQWGKYFFNRDLPESLGPNPLGSEDGYAFFRKDLPAPP